VGLVSTVLIILIFSKIVTIRQNELYLKMNVMVVHIDINVLQHDYSVLTP
jgi:hypothetical protein